MSTATVEEVEQLPLRISPQENLDLSQVTHIQLDELPPDYELPGPEPTAAFKQSVIDFGVISPIIVIESAFPTPGEARYQIQIGRRRVKAARAVAETTGLTTIPAQIILNPDAASLDTLIVTENAQRHDNPLSDLIAIENILERAKHEGRACNYGHIMKATGLSIPAIKRRLELRSLSSDIRAAVERGKIAISVAYGIAKLDDEQMTDLEVILDDKGKLTAADVKEVTRARKDAQVSALDMSWLDGDAEPVTLTPEAERRILREAVQQSVLGAITRTELPFKAATANMFVVTLPSGDTVRVGIEMIDLSYNHQEEGGAAAPEPEERVEAPAPEPEAEIVLATEEPAPKKRSHRKKKEAAVAEERPEGTEG